MPDWRNVYRRFVRLEREWSVHDHPEVNRQLFDSAVLSARSDLEIRRELASFGVADLPASLWNEARQLRQFLLNLPHHGRSPDDACEDVYQAALTMMPFEEWSTSASHEKIYRGQCDAAWPIVPSFFRKPLEDREAGLQRVNSYALAILQRRPELQTEQALALIQHYSKELAAQTWLIDVTWDPLVALFFASDGGRAGRLGVVTMLVRHEWENLSAGGRNRLGKIRLIEVPDVLRIERQRALFLDTSHPDLLEQYVAHSVWFHQVDGLVFEDEEAPWPVSKKRCYPDRDPTLELLRGVDAIDKGAPDVPLAPSSDATQSLGADDYLVIAKSWCEAEGVVLEPPYAEILAGVCRIYALLQQHRERLPIWLRSLHRLREATEIVAYAQEHRQSVDISKAMRFTLQRSMTDAERELLESLVDKFGEPAD